MKGKPTGIARMGDSHVADDAREVAILVQLGESLAGELIGKIREVLPIGLQREFALDEESHAGELSRHGIDRSFIQRTQRILNFTQSFESPSKQQTALR